MKKKEKFIKEKIKCFFEEALIVINELLEIIAKYS